MWKDDKNNSYSCLKIQGVLRVNEDNFPTRVAILARQLSSDWKKHTVAKIQFHSTQILQVCQKSVAASLLTTKCVWQLCFPRAEF